MRAYDKTPRIRLSPGTGRGEDDDSMQYVSLPPLPFSLCHSFMSCREIQHTRLRARNDDGILSVMFGAQGQEMTQESYEAKRTGITPEEFERQFQNRRQGSNIDLTDLLMRYGIARTPEQAQLVLASIIAFMLLVIVWQWSGAFSGPSYPAQADIDAALVPPTPSSR